MLITTKMLKNKDCAFKLSYVVYIMLINVENANDCEYDKFYAESVEHEKVL